MARLPEERPGRGGGPFPAASSKIRLLVSAGALTPGMLAATGVNPWTRSLTGIPAPGSAVLPVEKGWLKETARDLVALGGVPFLLLTIARVSPVALYYVLQFAVGGALVLLLASPLRAESHAGIGAVLLVFTSVFYGHPAYTAFALAVYAAMIASLFYLRLDGGGVVRGALLGFASALVSYLAVGFVT